MYGTLTICDSVRCVGMMSLVDTQFFREFRECSSEKSEPRWVVFVLIVKIICISLSSDIQKIYRTRYGKPASD